MNTSHDVEVDFEPPTVFTHNNVRNENDTLFNSEENVESVNLPELESRNRKKEEVLNKLGILLTLLLKIFF